jgi:coenzyme Q-binding protein COQ10
MRQFSTKRRVHHGAEEMFDLVADVERYPEFVPLCRELRVLRRAQTGEGVGILTANMTVAYKMIHETFTSRVTLDRANLKILVEYINGPFSQLDNRWSFRPLAHSECEVDFYIAYEFRSRALGMLMGAVFDTAFRRLSVAFEQRADIVYGRKAVQARA